MPPPTTTTSYWDSSPFTKVVNFLPTGRPDLSSCTVASTAIGLALEPCELWVLSRYSVVLSLVKVWTKA